MREKSEPTYVAARRVLDEGLAQDGSVFTPGRPVWSRPVADDLDRRFVQAPETGSATFVEKFHRQLDGAPAETVQLAAELVYLHLLAPDDIGPAAADDARSNHR